VGCLFGVVLRVVFGFGGFFWFVLVLFCYCSATEWLLNCSKSRRGRFPGIFGVPFVGGRVGTVWMGFPILSISCNWFWTFLETQNLAAYSFLHVTQAHSSDGHQNVPSNLRAKTKNHYMKNKQCYVMLNGKDALGLLIEGNRRYVNNNRNTPLCYSRM
jgi:hypothetical protein